ncbi:thioesterase domain-containing protein [Streptomyces pseudovenezuelae]|uniref:thioesterase II family protein n=1 Tax=Streptomyces pseudovenezuelae TaxID=67350 RepID=UPI0034A0DD47
MSDDQPVRLFCFPNSPEGVSVFDGWAAKVGAGVQPVPISLPGGGERRVEPRVTTGAALLADVMPQFTDPDPGPFILYGQALGAMAALTVARALHETGRPGPALLVVGAWPESHPPVRPADPRQATDEELLDVLSGNGAVPVGSDEAVWLRAMLPALRADLEFAHDLYALAGRPQPTGPLTTPVLVLDAGDDRPNSPSAADNWRQWTGGPVRSRTVPGHHFFRRGTRDLPRLLGRICRVADRLARKPAPIG